MTADIRETIRTKWFDKHVATLTDLGEVQILKWADPGQWCYRMEYIMRGNNLIVTGDLGHAVFDLTWKATPGSFKNITNIHYFMEKLAGGQRSKWTFDQEVFEKDLNEWFDEVTEDYKEDDKEYQEYEEIKEVLEHVTSEYSDCDVIESCIWFRLQDLDFHVESEDIQGFVNFGREVSSIYYSYLVGLQMANEQLEGKNNA